MAISLKKGGGISLKKENDDSGLKNILIGLGWTPPNDGKRYDFDASCFLLGAGGQVLNDESFVFYNNLVSPCGSVRHHGDNRTGAGDGDDEKISVDLTKIPENITTLIFAVTIAKADTRQQTFSNVTDAYIRIVNEENGEEVARYDLAHMPESNTMVFGKIIKKDGEWSFMAIDEPRIGGILALAQTYGVEVSEGE